MKKTLYNPYKHKDKLLGYKNPETSKKVAQWVTDNLKKYGVNSGYLAAFDGSSSFLGVPVCMKNPDLEYKFQSKHSTHTSAIVSGNLVIVDDYCCYGNALNTILEKCIFEDNTNVYIFLIDSYDKGDKIESMLKSGIKNRLVEYNIEIFVNILNRQ
jgi:hypothetical protein